MPNSASPREIVQRHFRTSAGFWKDIYAGKDVYSAIHQLRRSTVLRLVDELDLEDGSAVLDAGCGAGSISVALAQRGFRVNAIDAAPEMVELATRAAGEAGMGWRVCATIGSVERLALRDESVSLALAIGVLPWLVDYDAALAEIARVVKPGAHAIINVDNCWGVHRLVDPGTNFLLAPLRRRARSVLGFCGLVRSGVVPATQISARRFRKLLRRAGFEVRRGVMLGFGPFTIFEHRLFSDVHGLALHQRLQEMADRSAPIIRSMGAQYLVLAQRATS